MKILEVITLIIILVTAFGTFSNSVRSRKAKKEAREALRAKMNMHMGGMFLGITMLQILSYKGSSFQLTVAFLIALLGLFNLFVGFRNFQLYRKYLPK